MKKPGFIDKNIYQRLKDSFSDMKQVDANKINHFILEILEMVSSIQIDSMLGVSQWDNLLATMSSRTKTIFPPPFESQSFLN